MNFLYKLNHKYYGRGIKNLMLVVVCGMGFVYLVDVFFPAYSVISLISLDMGMVLKGQIWRLVTFIFIPPATGITALIAIYFYYMIGSALENEWGTFLFNAYYFIGIIGAIVAAAMTGWGVNTYLNLSLFFAFAILYPDFQVLLFFIIPIKIKYLAWIDAALFAFMFIVGGWAQRAAIVLSLLNLFIFFGKDVVRRIKNDLSYMKTRRQFRNANSRTKWN